MSSPLAAIIGMRRFFFAILGSDEVRAMRKPDAPAMASAGTRSKKPQGIVSLTFAITAVEPNSSEATVESQKVRIVTNPIIPAIG